MPNVGPLVDGYGRIHNDLRLSVTESCNLRCIYCMDEDNVDFLKKSKYLSVSQLSELLRVFKKLGIKSIRLTGGEPLIRKEIVEIVKAISTIGFEDIALTTNGMLLQKYAKSLYAAGLKRVNLSIDSLDPLKFAKIRRRGDLETVLRGLEELKILGFADTKVNVVALKGFNDDEILNFIEFSIQYDVAVRFIELMPVGATDLYRDENVLTKNEILTIISSKWDFVENKRVNSPAVTYTGTEIPFTFGIISSMSESFCGDCNRLRLTADGFLRNCLFSTTETPLSQLLDEGANEREIETAVRTEIFRKRFGHGTDTVGYAVPNKPIYKVGG